MLGRSWAPYGLKDEMQCLTACSDILNISLVRARTRTDHQTACHPPRRKHLYHRTASFMGGTS